MNLRELTFRALWIQAGSVRVKELLGGGKRLFSSGNEKEGTKAKKACQAHLLSFASIHAHLFVVRSTSTVTHCSLLSSFFVVLFNKLVEPIPFLSSFILQTANEFLRNDEAQFFVFVPTRSESFRIFFAVVGSLRTTKL